MKDKLFAILKKEKKAISFEQLVEKAQLGSLEEEKEFLEAFNKGLKDYSIIKTSKDRFILREKTSFRVGRYFAGRNGDGKVSVTYSYEKDGQIISKNNVYEVDSNHAGNAVDGDIVLVNLYSEHRNSPLKGCVQTIINRKLNTIVGEVFRNGIKYYVKPLDKRKNIVIKLDEYAVEGSKVAVDVGEQIADREYSGVVTRTFNHKYDPREDLLLEAFKCGVECEFSKETLEEAKKVPKEVLDSDRIGRVDLTDWEIFTIDSKDTKDIDDALSYKKLDDGNYLIGVHIADVSHYVPLNSAMEKDAYKRGTSVYLPGLVFPMLPRELSNGICSLNPNVDRLALSCIMEVTPNGEVVHHDVVKSVIHSRLKMTYDQVNNVLHDKEYDSVYKPYVSTLKELNILANKLEKKRIKAGALSFDKPEISLTYDEDGHVTGVSSKVRDLAEKLIEEYMLLANETVDKHLVSLNIPCLHRIHDLPNEDRMEEFFRLLHALGNDYQKSDYLTCSTDPHALQDLEKFIRKSGSLSNVLSSNLIRCMSRAKYSPNNIGHFGLAKDYYCHFTSPIRRYPDLTIHRLLKSQIDHTDCREVIAHLEEIGMQSSRMERIAAEAEEKTLRMRLAEYYSGFIGKEYQGVISGLNDKGMEVQLDNYVEGRIKIKDMPGSYCQQGDFSLVSLSGKDDYHVGDRLNMRLIRSDKQDKSIDFQPLQKIYSISRKDTKVLKKSRV